MHVEIESRMDLDVARTRLRRDETGSGVWISLLTATWSLFTRGETTRVFVRLRGDRVKAWRVRPLLSNPYIYVLSGTITALPDGGSVLRGEADLWLPGKILTAVWFALLAGFLVFAATGMSSWWPVLAAVLMAAVGAVFLRWMYVLAGRNLARLRTHLEERLHTGEV